jgi:hypothetical protein
MSVYGWNFVKKFEDEYLSEKFSAEMEFCEIDPRLVKMEVWRVVQFSTMWWCSGGKLGLVSTHVMLENSSSTWRRFYELVSALFLLL